MGDYYISGLTAYQGAYQRTLKVSSCLSDLVDICGKAFDFNTTSNVEGEWVSSSRDANSYSEEREIGLDSAAIQHHLVGDPTHLG